MEVTAQDESAGPVALPIDDLLDEFEKGPVETQVAPEGDLPKVETEDTPEAKAEKPEAKEKPKKPKDDPVAKLEREVAEARAREQTERQQREKYALYAAQKAREAQAAMARAQTSDYDLASNALDAATDKMTTLEQQLASAFAEGDGPRVASIQKQMSVLGARITMLEDVKSRLEHQAEIQRQRAQAQARQRQQQPRQQQGDPFEASISHFSEPSKQWIRQHRDLVVQPGKWNEVVRAHHVAEDQGLQPDTPEYFAFIEKKLKLRDDDGDVEVVTQKPKRSIPAAPVSRDPAIGGVDAKRVTLTPQEIQTASDLGMSKEEYAKFKLQALKDGRYDFQQRI